MMHYEQPTKHGTKDNSTFPKWKLTSRAFWKPNCETKTEPLVSPLPDFKLMHYPPAGGVVRFG